MAHDRTAIDTIRGYYYQFDFFINQVFLSSEDDVILLEGIEDIDIHTATEWTAVQCKYYEGTEFNISVIAEPVRWMLSYFLSHQDIKYHLYGYYKSGTEKLSRCYWPVSVLLKYQTRYSHNAAISLRCV